VKCELSGLSWYKLAYRLDAVYSSDLRRPYRTAELDVLQCCAKLAHQLSQTATVIKSLGKIRIEFNDMVVV